LQGFGGIDEIITQWQPVRILEYSVSPAGPLRNGLSLWQLTDLGNGNARLDIQLSYNLGMGIIGKLMHALVMRKKLQGSLTATSRSVKSKVEAAHGEKALNTLMPAS